MPDFDGYTLGEQPDHHERLRQQLARVHRVLADHEWHTPQELEKATGDNWASAGARLRDLRKKKFGGYKIERLYLGGGLYKYRLIPSIACPPCVAGRHDLCEIADCLCSC